MIRRWCAGHRTDRVDIPGFFPAGAVTRTAFGQFNMEREWQASIRGRVAYAWDRFLVHATGGIAATSVSSGSNFVFNTVFNNPPLSLVVGPPTIVTGHGRPAAQDFYGVTIGVGFTHIESDSTDTCIGSGLLNGANPLCNTSVLLARGSANPAFFVVGGGAEWMFAQNWSFKGEYLYMGLDTNFNVCGPAAGRQLVSGLTFCANHNVDGIHTAKFGVNFKFM